MSVVITGGMGIRLAGIAGVSEWRRECWRVWKMESLYKVMYPKSQSVLMG